MPDPKELIEIQVVPSAIQPDTTATATDLIIPPMRVADRLRHFPENIYDTSPESHLSRLMKVLLGDSGAGRLRKVLLMQRLRATLQGSHFFDLDRFYGPLFGMRRSANEVLNINPYQGVATRDQWDDIYARDASFRSRIEQFARAIPFGATPVGMELIAEAVLAADCEILEEYIKADSGYQTYQDLEDGYGENLLTDNQASVEDDATPWTITGGIDALVQSDNWFYPDGFTAGGGAHSVEIEATGGSDAEFEGDFFVPDIAPGTEYTFALVAHTIGVQRTSPADEEGFSSPGTSPGDIQRVVFVSIEWQESDGTPISTDDGDATVVPFGVDTQVFCTATAPANAARAVPHVTVVDPEAGDFLYFDRFEFSILNLADMEGELYSILEGYGLPVMFGDDRRLFTVRAKRDITLAEAFDLGKVLDKLKPAEARYQIDMRQIGLYEPVNIREAVADSIYWEIISKITVLSPVSRTLLPYQVLSGDPEEQPKPPFSAYQGEAWSYVHHILGVAASYIKGSNGSELFNMPTAQVNYASGAEPTVYPPDSSVLPTRMVQAGRAVSDAVILTYAYPTALGERDRFLIEQRRDSPFNQIFVDGIPLDALNRAINTLGNVDPWQQNPEHRYWVTDRPNKQPGDEMMSDPTIEELRVNLRSESRVNYITFELAKFPHEAVVEVSPGGEIWTEVFRHRITASSPAVFEEGREGAMREGHPHHNHPGHWEKVSRRIPSQMVRAIRIRMQRIEGIPPVRVRRDPISRQVTETIEMPYTLAVRSLDLGYRVTSREDFDFLESGETLGESLDMIGSNVQFEVRELLPARATDDSDSTAWKSEPQPVSYAVVNFFLDTRDDDGEPQTIDRFYIDPTHSGVKFNIYYSNDPQESDGTDDFYEARRWSPIPRSYSLQKGYVHVPPTRAKYWKFEFTNLVAEPYESFVPILRRTKFFPTAMVKALEESVAFGHAEEANLPGMTVATAITDQTRYRDALAALRRQGAQLDPSQYRPTESLYVIDPESQARLRDEAWTFGFMPWHQDDAAYPRFDRVGKHEYEIVEVLHRLKVAFFVGLRTIKAYRVRVEAEENTEIYFDCYNDTRNLEPAFGWTFNPGYLTSLGTTPPVSFESRVMLSRSPVRAVQFATVQSDPLQLVPDHSFRNAAFWGTYNWDNPDFWLKVGNPHILYSPGEYTVTVIRQSSPAPLPEGSVSRTINRKIVDPIFSFRQLVENPDEGAEGTRTPLIPISPEGRVFVAARFTMLTDQTSPLYLQVYDDQDNLVMERAMPGRRGETVEDYFEIDTTGISGIRTRLVQKGVSDDIWKVASQAVFEDSVVWEFSVNGGDDWFPANLIRNNDNGILTFPVPGNQMKYRARTYRDNVWVSAIKIRPHYLGVGNARASSNNRGPNLSVYDSDIPIHEDPMFTQWKRPIPWWWFAESRRFPLLTIGEAASTEFSNTFGRPVSETVDEPTADASAEVIKVRFAAENLAGITDEVDRALDMSRDIEEVLDEPTEEAEAFEQYGQPDRINAPIPDDI